MVLKSIVDLDVVQGGKPASAETQGSGVQRLLIAELIQAAEELQYANKAKQKAQDGFRWLLFEEPEAFLHPTQVARLTRDLISMSTSSNVSIMVTTHDPTVLSQISNQLPNMIRLNRTKAQNIAASPSRERLRQTLDEAEVRTVYGKASSSCYKTLGAVRPTKILSENIVHYFDKRRAASLFSDRVIIVEGLSDVAAFEWLLRNEKLESTGENLTVHDAGGKFELHRAASLMNLWQIPYVVIWDNDAFGASDPNKIRTQKCQDKAALQVLLAATSEKDSSFRGGLRTNGTIEHWLGLETPKQPSWKAANLTVGLADLFSEDSTSQIVRKISNLDKLLKCMFDGENLEGFAQSKDLADCLIVSAPTEAPNFDFRASIVNPAESCPCLLQT